MTATTMKIDEVGASSDMLEHWHDINWAECHKNVKRLQARIVKATAEGRWGKVKNLQRILTHSFSAKAIAVKRVTENLGKRTAGVDGETWNTPESKADAIDSLKRRGYKSSPLRRVEIPKKNGKKRKLGIPTMKDRAMQALHLLALEPVAETTGDQNSYGFRPERSTADAREQAFNALAKAASPQWILEGDIKGCFDNISHEWLLGNIPTDRKILKEWLKAGVIYNGELNETETGTPQGGIISPTLANLALDGLEKVINHNFKTLRYWENEVKKSKNPKVNFIRYADDFIITGISKELLENEVKPLVKNFLKERGLELSPEKTKITHIKDGFDFLGWNFRKYNSKLLIKPSKESVKSILRKVKEILDSNKTTKTENVINLLNPVITGWANYHKGTVAKETFSYVDHQIWMKTWQWAVRRHPNKGKIWIKEKYFKSVDNRHWVFSGDNQGEQSTRLASMSEFPIERHIKIQANANPYDPKYEQYFEKRLHAKMTKGQVGKTKLARLWVQQKGICPVCNMRIDDVENFNIHHIVEKAKGGKDINSNLVILHPNCHRKVHSRNLKVGKPDRETDL
ncbi:group II intron reverse transcriptase/maturase [Methylobacter sp. BlB1]|uniref:group II intron reverse transcriptase/maturase n=1 Tax=Methylobacter sp. BlB1 TaxID=2785914 RepID=UPI0018943C71|nr:group II intron reverse transcriptase/maturase [Methylobacter sp. BlB1]MBF6650016.1 group II intron reverse transcriptase/maturase [Methylobacter sp. BlB1]